MEEVQENIRLDGRVAIVTGAGRGLGRCYALALAGRGARVVVNDLMESDGNAAISPADAVVEEIRSGGGEALAQHADVTCAEQIGDMIESAIRNWSRVDILVNNAGIVRDHSFAKLSAEDFRLVMNIHLFGAFHCCKAVWRHMREQEYGRIVNIVSAAGLFGNFGQSNYAAAKMAIVGLTNTLREEGVRQGIRSNCFAPAAATRMTEDVLPPEVSERLNPATVAPGLVYLCSDNAPNGVILAAAGGSYSRVMIQETRGTFLAGKDNSPEAIAESWPAISDAGELLNPTTASEHVGRFLTQASNASRDGEPTPQ